MDSSVVAVFAARCNQFMKPGNDYSKELQFKALEASAAADEEASVLRQGS